VALLYRPTAQPQSQRLALRRLLFWALVVGSVGLAAFLAVAQSSRITETGYRLRQWERLREQRQAQVYQAEAEVARLASLDRVAQEAARRLGMGPPESVEYIYLEAPPPSRPSIPSRFRPPEPAVPQGRSWWARLLHLLPLP